MMALEDWLLIGLVIYVVVSLLHLKSFKNADIQAILKGFLFFVVLWPVALAWFLFGKHEKDEK